MKDQSGWTSPMVDIRRRLLRAAAWYRKRMIGVGRDGKLAQNKAVGLDHRLNARGQAGDAQRERHRDPVIGPQQHRHRARDTVLVSGQVDDADGRAFGKFFQRP